MVSKNTLQVFETIIFMAIFEVGYLQGDSRLRNVAYRSKCLQTVSQYESAGLELAECSDSNGAQRLTITSKSEFLSQITFDSNEKCVSAENVGNGSHAFMGSCSTPETATQLWEIYQQDEVASSQIYQLNSGWLRLRLRDSNSCLTPECQGLFMDLWDCVDDAWHQWWEVEDVTKEATVQQFVLFQHVFYADECLQQYFTGHENIIAFATCNDADERQKINVISDYHATGGGSLLQFIGSNKCMGAMNGNVAVVDCSKDESLLWHISYQETIQGNFKLSSQLDTGNCVNYNGDLDPCDTLAWLWKFRNPTTETHSGSSKPYGLANLANSGKCLRPQDLTNQNAELQLEICDITAEYQRMNLFELKIDRATPGYVMINSLCLTVKNNGIDNGVAVVLLPCEDLPSQRWIVVNGDIDAVFQLQNEHSGRCLTAEDDGSRMDQWDCLGISLAPHQTWMINEELPTPPAGE